MSIGPIDPPRGPGEEPSDDPRKPRSELKVMIGPM